MATEGRRWFGHPVRPVRRAMRADIPESTLRNWADHLHAPLDTLTPDPFDFNAAVLLADAIAYLPDRSPAALRSIAADCWHLTIPAGQGWIAFTAEPLDGARVHAVADVPARWLQARVPVTLVPVRYVPSAD